MTAPNDNPRRGRRTRPASTSRRRSATRQTVQQALPLRRRPTWGGKREGAGRKPTGKKAGIPHRSRPPLASRFPVHVTLRVRPDVWNLRSRRAFDRIGRAIEEGKETKAGFRLVHYTVQGNHLHLVCEGRDAGALSRGVQGLAIRMAKGLNRMMGRKGQVFADRYHARILRTPREVKNVLAYVFRNFSKHFDEWTGNGRGAARRDGGGTERGASRGAVGGDEPGLLDPYSSARFFEGFRGPVWLPDWGPRDPPAGAQPRTWLLNVGWRKVGRIGLA